MTAVSNEFIGVGTSKLKTTVNFPATADKPSDSLLNAETNPTPKSTKLSPYEESHRMDAKLF